MASSDKNSRGSDTRGNSTESSQPISEAASSSEDLKSMLNRSMPAKPSESRITLETKLGMVTISILVVTFGVLVYRKVDRHQQRLTEASIPPQLTGEDTESFLGHEVLNSASQSEYVVEESLPSSGPMTEIGEDPSSRSRSKESFDANPFDRLNGSDEPLMAAVDFGSTSPQNSTRYLTDVGSRELTEPLGIETPVDVASSAGEDDAPFRIPAMETATTAVGVEDATVVTEQNDWPESATRETEAVPADTMPNLTLPLDVADASPQSFDGFPVPRADQPSDEAPLDAFNTLESGATDPLVSSEPAVTFPAAPAGDLLIAVTDDVEHGDSAIAGNADRTSQQPVDLAVESSAKETFPQFPFVEQKEPDIELAMLDPQPQQDNPFATDPQVPAMSFDSIPEPQANASSSTPKLLFPDVDSSHRPEGLQSGNQNTVAPADLFNTSPPPSATNFGDVPSRPTPSQHAPAMFPTSTPPRRTMTRTADGKFSLAAFNYQNSVTEPVDDGKSYDIATVQPGENYYLISKRVYGTIRYFSALAVFNQHRIPEPAKMRPGMKILTPPREVLEERYPELFADSRPRQTQPPRFIVRDDGSAWYRVGENETLSEISERFLGRSARWIEIYRLNQSLLKDPNLLKPGITLALPDDAVEVNISP